METMTLSDCIELFKTFRKRQEGQTMAEYAVVLGVITLAVVAAFAGLSGQVGSAVTDIVGRI